MVKTLPHRNGVARKSALVGPDGKPLSSFLYPSPRHSPKSYKPRIWLHESTKKNVGEYDRRELVNLSRQLVSQIDVLGAAVEDKNTWAFGDAWDVHYTGTYQAWGEEFEDFINNVWMPTCNVRGPQYDFKTSLKLSGVAWDRDGDDAMILTETEAGFPQLAFYPCTRIASRANVTKRMNGARSAGFGSDETVVGGPFDGAKIFDGIIYDRNNRMIGLRIVNEENDQFQDISAFNADLAYEPAFCDQGRGWPKIAVGVLRWMNLQDIDGLIQKGIKRATAISLIKKTEEGEAPTGNEILTETEVETSGTGLDGTDFSGHRIIHEELEGGEVEYLSAAGGESIEALTYKNPHPNVEAAIERMTRGALRSIGWFLELVNLATTGRAPARILCDLANESIWSRQKTGYRRFRRAVSYATAKAMKEGYLSRNPDIVDAMSYEPGLPKPLQVDAGNDAQADREALKMGMTTKAIYAQKAHGMHYRQLDKQREMEIRQTIEAAERLSAEHPKISFDRALELLEQRSPNPISQNNQRQATAAPVAAPNR